MSLADVYTVLQNSILDLQKAGEAMKIKQEIHAKELEVEKENLKQITKDMTA